MHAGRPPSIGRPIANTQIYILDEHLRQVPIGESGELYIGGVGLARGYLNRPELTAERFIAHPFSNEPGARLYKTGDWARYLPDGQIAFMGRTDQQVKIRGFRIELEEIEAILNQHPAVRQSVVIAREDVPGEKHLVAYLVTDLDITSLDTDYAIRRSQVGSLVAGPQSNTSLDRLSPLLSNYFVSATELRDFFHTQLPDYMIPASFVVLEALPLTPNGKVDRAALPAPHENNTLPDVPTTAPSTPLEKQLAAMVAPLLGLKQVGIDDNFFMLGGHSLLGTQVIVLVAETFGVDIPLRTLFEASTVRQLSAEIERLLIARLEMMSDEEAQRLLMEQVYST